MDLLDYSDAAVGMTYTNDLNPDGLLLDGTPEAANEAGIPQWEVLTGPQGTLVSTGTLDASFEVDSARFFWADDASPDFPQCDTSTTLAVPDAKALGMSGVWLDGALPDTDPKNGSTAYTLTRRILLPGTGTLPKTPRLRWSPVRSDRSTCGSVPRAAPPMLQPAAMAPVRRVRRPPARWTAFPWTAPAALRSASRPRTLPVVQATVPSTPTTPGTARTTVVMAPAIHRWRMNCLVHPTAGGFSDEIACATAACGERSMPVQTSRDAWSSSCAWRHAWRTVAGPVRASTIVRSRRAHRTSSARRRRTCWSVATPMAAF